MIKNLNNKPQDNQDNGDFSYSILVVEDDINLNKFICSQLTKCGFKISSALNGIECINNLRSKKFTLLLTDYVLPDLTIEDIIIKLREIKRVLPFIVMTGYGDEKIAVSMMKLGAQDYIVKDAKFVTRLPEVIKRVIHEVEAGQRLISLKNSLLENEERLRLFTENTKDIIVLIDSYGNIKWSNATWNRTYGGDYTSIPAMKNLLDPEDMKVLIQSWNGLLSQNNPINNLTYRIKNKQDRYNVYESDVFPLTMKGEKLFYVISRDITENVEAGKKNKWVEEQLQNSKRAELLSKVTSGIAEDFNNIMTAIAGYANLLIDSIQEKFQLEYAKKIYELAMNGGEINGKLVMLGHQSNYNIEAISIHSVINSVLDNLQNRKNGNVSVETKFNARSDSVNADQTLMETAIRNIIQNAYEAIHEKGKISIQTELNHVDSNIDSSSADKNKHKSFLEISVKDTGIGISNNNKGKIFEPFFSTKKKGYCNGLGLSIADRLIKQLNGHITFQSESEQGTEIVIHLPIAEDSNNSQININDIRNEKTCNSVLVIDDDQSIREMATIMLNRLGCSVRCCEDGEKGYSYFLANHSKIDLIILDLIMPNLSGNECFYKLREVDSNIPIIICSGFSEQKIVQELHLYNAVYFLQKPFSFKNLSNAVAEIVSEK